MIVMRPIDEPLVLQDLNRGRFPDDVRGYVVMDEAAYLGHALFRVADGVTQVLECAVAGNALVDGAVRACVAAGENAGATAFQIPGDDPQLAQWRAVFIKDTKEPAPNALIFKTCE